MIVLEILQYILAVILGLLLGYQLLLSLVALGGRNIKNFAASENRRFAIVLPAYNEEKMISKTLYSLFGLVYPKSLYDVFVVADNCTDQTASIAQDLGAIVLERKNEKLRGKGYALDWAFNRILSGPDEYDAIVVFDSDSLISGNFLEVMNYYIDKGSKVIQSSDLVLPQPGNWSSEATRIGFLLYNYVKPLGRKVLGLNMGLRGNGMCFSSGILKSNPWSAWSLTEDVEFGLSLLLKGIKVDFAPEAIVWAQMPVNSNNAESQRTRWEMGRYQIFRNYAPKLLKATIKEKSIAYADVLIDLITPPLVNTLIVVGAIWSLNMVLWLSNLITPGFLIVWTGIAAMGFLHLLVGLLAAGADKELYKSVLYIPVYALWKLKVYVKAWRTGADDRWIRTTRESN